jgi:hypothetical protein
VFGSVPAPYIIAMLVYAASPAFAQTDLTTTKQAVRECVTQVRQDAMRAENYQYGQPPMWRKFDAYISPDGRVHNNAKLVGEQDGVYRFEKCLAEHGFSLGSGASNNPPKPQGLCTQDEIDYRPGDCWTKLLAWDKRVLFQGFVSGWIHSHDFAERQQYNRIGTSNMRFLANFDQSKFVPHLDQLYSVPENRTIWFSDAFDLLFRTQTNPKTKDIPGLTTLYRNHEEPLFRGYLRDFIPPNRVVISQFDDSYRLPPNVRNKTITLTLLSVSTNPNAKAVIEFMKALLNVKQCNTLIHMKDAYKHYTYYKTDKDREQAQKLAEYGFAPQLETVIMYPWAYDYQQEEFFNARNELSGAVLLKRGQSVCMKKEGEFAQDIKLGQLMLEGAENKNAYGALHLLKDTGNDFINLNQYLTANGLRTIDQEEDDPREGHKYFGLFNPAPTPEGVKTILKIGAAQ